MTNQELERRLAKAVSQTAPDDLEDILSRCETRKGNVIHMMTRKSKPLLRNLIAACLLLALLGGGGVFYQQSYAVTSIVSLDVNPSIELEVNKKEKVLSCLALNAEAQEVLANMNQGADLKGAKLDVAVNAIVGALVRSGYLDSISSAILISVDDKNQNRAAKLQQELTATVDVILRERASDATVLSQTVVKDTALEKKARENNISTGKASLIDRVMGLNRALNFDALTALSVEELKDMLETGAPGMPIGKTEAIRLAKAYANLTNSNLLAVEADAELDDITAHYDVDLYTSAGEFEYMVDAYTGKILRGREDVLTPETTPEKTPESTSTPPAGNTLISETDAFDIAAADFSAKYPELKNANILNNRVELDRDDGTIHYDVEFFLSGYEIDYEIDASTGKILSWNTDYEGPRIEPEPVTTDIGSDKAKSIALAHAGLTESQITQLRVEKDRDDGRIEYELEFKCDGMEYEYTIDAVTGAVLQHEKDWDD